MGDEKLQMPYQCIVACGNLLLAARGSSIDSFSLEDGSLLSTTQCPPSQGSQGRQNLKETTTKMVSQSPGSFEDLEPGVTSPLAKKRKLDSSEAVDLRPASNQRTPNMMKKNKYNERSEAIATGLDAPAVVTLIVTKDANHVIVVTGEDKTIRVFENLFENGVHQLKLLSERTMPKRPCAIALTDEDSTIISADKFGDVYSLPLSLSDIHRTPRSATHALDPTSKTFVPAANEFTIHSQRNRKALENQRRQANRNIEKSEATFEHKLLLGHVSMLTDLALVTLQGRSYIITADRDEHIRISRGLSQTHIIERFCLGHTEFISRICILKDKPNVLISGGGEDEILVWDWLSGKLSSKANLKQYVTAVKRELGIKPENDVPLESINIVVSGILHLQEAAGFDSQDLIAVTCEGVPAIFVYSFIERSRLAYVQTFRLPGNVLAVVQVNASSRQGLPNGLIVSIDTIHKAGSTVERRMEGEVKMHPLQSLVFQDGKLAEDKLSVPLKAETGVDFSLDSTGSALGRITNLLYNLENLRKRDGDRQEG